MFLTITYNQKENKFYFDYSDGTSYIFSSTEAAIQALVDILQQRTLCFINSAETIAKNYIHEAYKINRIEIEV